jgi:serine/threonine protein kinase
MSLAGTRLGHYELVSILGAGGMGDVYRARDTRLHRDVAIKVLPAAFTSDPDRLARFEREARALAALNYPHIGAICRSPTARPAIWTRSCRRTRSSWSSIRRDPAFETCGHLAPTARCLALTSGNVFTNGRPSRPTASGSPYL